MNIVQIEVKVLFKVAEHAYLIYLGFILSVCLCRADSVMSSVTSVRIRRIFVRGYHTLVKRLWVISDPKV